MLTRLLTLVADRSPAGGGLALSAPPHLFPPVPGRPASRKYSPCSGRDFLRRSEEHTSELQSPCISYAVFCLDKKDTNVVDLVVLYLFSTLPELHTQAFSHSVHLHRKHQIIERPSSLPANSSASSAHAVHHVQA